jgi:hypothetical protein
MSTSVEARSPAHPGRNRFARFGTRFATWLATGVATRALWWLLPVVFLFWLYREAFFTWFIADDFAWLSLLRLVRVRHDLLHELFAPMAQGTIRPWSERGFFMLLQSLFGLESMPFRVVVFATAAVDTLLIAWMTRRLVPGGAASRLAGAVAGILWVANAALVRPMDWSSAYNEIMCPLFLLSALALFIRYIETGRQAFWWWQLVVFCLGFGALELNVVYPALAAAWVLFAAPAPSLSVPPLHIPQRTALRSLIPLAAISTAYYALHRLVAPLPVSGPYVLHFDASMLKALALYSKWSLAPEPMNRFGHGHHHPAAMVFLIGSVALAAFVAAELKRRRLAVLFCLAWFLITLAPLVPLTGHLTDYYLTIPLIGIAMLGGAAAGQYWNKPMAQRALVAIPLAVYLWATIPVTLAVTHWWRIRTDSVRGLVLGVVAARQTHPGKAIALQGVTTELFADSIGQSAFRALGIYDVYLTPGSELSIQGGPDTADLESLVLGTEVMSHAVTHDDVVVYSLKSDHLRNITEGYARSMALRTVGRLPSRVDVGNILNSWLLGPEWLPPESGIRWMPGSATLRLGVPASGSQLELEGRCPSAQLFAVPRHLMVLVDGKVAADTRIYDPESSFHRLFPMSAALAGKTSVNVEIRVDPVDRIDGQDYGLVFGNISVRP